MLTGLRFLTAGESHGRALTVIVDGLPAGLAIDQTRLQTEMARRQRGFGRGGRMKLETDAVQVISGVRFGTTIGAPVALQIVNRDWENWEKRMSQDPALRDDVPAVTVPRPGHADLAGLVKYGRRDFRDVLERASARETAARTAVGALCKQLLNHFGIEIAGHVLQIGAVESKAPRPDTVSEIRRLADESDVRCIDPEASAKMVEAIAAAKQSRDTLGGIFEVCASGVPVGLGSYAQWDRKLDGRLAQALCSIPAVKGVEIGPGFQNASVPGSKVHDEIFPASEQERKAGKAVRRGSNRAGGLEGGVSNGEWIVVRAAKKPISSLLRPLQSIDFFSKEPKPSHYERSDICAVPPAAVIGEAMMAIILADAMLEKFGGDSLVEMVRNWRAYQDYVASL